MSDDSTVTFALRARKMPEDSAAQIRESMAWNDTVDMSSAGFFKIGSDEFVTMYKTVEERYAKALRFSAHIQTIALETLGDLIKSGLLTVPSGSDIEDAHSCLMKSTALISSAVMWAIAHSDTMIDDDDWVLQADEEDSVIFTVPVERKEEEK